MPKLLVCRCWQNTQGTLILFNERSTTYRWDLALEDLLQLNTLHLCAFSNRRISLWFSIDLVFCVSDCSQEDRKCNIGQFPTWGSRFYNSNQCRWEDGELVMIMMMTTMITMVKMLIMSQLSLPLVWNMFNVMSLRFSCYSVLKPITN